MITSSSNISLTLLLFLFFFVSRCHSILDPLDFLALQSIRKSMSDLPGSTFFSAWDFTSDPCNFPGVYCLGDKVTALNLGDPRAGSPGLSGRLDPALGDLSALTELSLVPGRVTGPLPETLTRLTDLRFLAASKNFLTGHIPDAIASLRQLRTVDLSYNQLSGQIPPSIGRIPSLSDLILCHNRFTGPVPDLSSTSLVRLDLKHNDLSGWLSPLPPSLQYLSLSSNRLTGWVDRILTRLARLSYLDLSMNRFTGLIPGTLFSFPMSSLQLQRNLFVGPVHPVDQVSIATVDLSYNRLSGQISPMFASVENLYLNNNRFTGQVPGSFVDRLLSAGIQILYLQHNFLTGIEINPTAEIPLSSSLCLQYNCMAPPVQTPSCPVMAGKVKTRPVTQCGMVANSGD